MNAPRIVTRKKTKGNDTYAIYLQQFLNGKKIRISLGICVHLNFWDKKRRRIKRGMKNASRYNRIIGKAISKAEEILTAYELKGVILDKETFVREYRNPASREAKIGKPYNAKGKDLRNIAHVFGVEIDSLFNTPIAELVK